MELINLIDLTNTFGCVGQYVNNIKRILYEKRENINDYNGDYKTPLYYAKNPAIIKFLLDNGANPNGCNVSRKWEDGITTYFSLPIIEAISSYNRKKLQLLLAYGANPNLISAADYGFYGRSDVFTALKNATQLVDYEMISMLITYGANIHLTPDYNPIREYTTTLKRDDKIRAYFSVGWLENYLKIIKLYIDQGVEITVADVTDSYVSRNTGLAYFLAGKCKYASRFEDYEKYLHEVLKSKNCRLLEFFVLFTHGMLDRNYIQSYIKKKNIPKMIYNNIIENVAFPTLFDLLYFRIISETYEPVVVADDIGKLEFRRHHLL